MPCKSIHYSNSETLTTMKSLDEADVGIFCFISQFPGFRGILKQRYSDFIVNEVDSDGNVVHLTCLDAPPEVVGENDSKRPDSDFMTRSYASEVEAFKSLVGESDAELLKAFIDNVTSGSGDSISPIVLSPSSDKSHRTAIHQFFKEKLRFLVTDTVDGLNASSKCVRVRFNSGGLDDRGRSSKKRKDRGDKAFDSRGASSWPEHLGRFIRFHLCKENKDTHEVLGLIGRMLGVQPRSFGFAGTKDKRSVSTQRVTVFKQQASRLAALNDRLIGIKVGDFCYVKEGIVLGQLFGNRFTITLRGVIAESDDTIEASADALGRCGFINYFGLQRFGSGSVPTHLIGAALLRGEWEKTVNMILDPREGERQVITNAREYYKESHDIQGTLRQLPRHLVAERAILQCLKKCPGNYLQALKAIPRTLRMMYVHSYQSYLWNHAASERIQKYGTGHVVPGDLVHCQGDDNEKLSSEFEYNCDDSYDQSQLDEISESDLHERTSTTAKALTAEDIHSGNYTIYNIILPMPGSRVMFPTNDVAQVYHDLAKKDGINLSESTHRVKEFSITSMNGSYRQVFQKPLDYEWELLTYTDGNISLAETDLDKISKAESVNVVKEDMSANGNRGIDCLKQSDSLENDIELTADTNEAESEKAGLSQVESLCCSESQEVQKDMDKIAKSESVNIVKEDMSANGNRGIDCLKQSDSLENDIKLTTDTNEAESEKAGLSQVESLCGSNSQEIQKALKLSFTLPASCYATMAMRELLKTSTSVAFHKTLNQ